MDVLETALSHPITVLSVRGESHNGRGHAGFILERPEHRRLAEYFDERGNLASNNRAATSLRLDGRPPEAFIARGKQQRHGTIVERLYDLHARRDDLNDAIANMELIRKLYQICAQRGACKYQLQVCFLLHFCEYPQYAFTIFACKVSADVKDERLLNLRQTSQSPIDFAGRKRLKRVVESIQDDAQISVLFQNSARIFICTPGYAGHPGRTPHPPHDPTLQESSKERRRTVRLLSQCAANRKHVVAGNYNGFTFYH